MNEPIRAGCGSAGLSSRWMRRFMLLLSVFGPATIAAMADNDAGGVATYSIAGATLGYPILFLLFDHHARCLASRRRWACA